MLSDDKVTEIYCMADDFCKFFNETVKKHTLQVSDGKRHRNKPNRMSDAEVITVLVVFHMSGHRSFNNFIVNTVSAIAAYCFFPEKPAISLEHYSDNQLMLF